MGFFSTAAARLGLDGLSRVEMNRRSGLGWWCGLDRGGWSGLLLTSNLLARLRVAFA